MAPIITGLWLSGRITLHKTAKIRENVRYMWYTSVIRGKSAALLNSRFGVFRGNGLHGT